MTNFSNFVFFGTDEFAVTILDELDKQKCYPNLIVTTPGPSPVKIWAKKNSIPFLEPSSLRPDLETSLRSGLGLVKLFLVASYGRIIPATIFNLPKHGTLNIHPSLLPEYRGATPIQTAILDGKTESGVTLMLMDDHLDHGPIVAQSPLLPIARHTFPAARYALAQVGAKLFLDNAPLWVVHKLEARPQDHKLATYTQKIKKEDGLIDLTADPQFNYRKFLAYNGWPGVYFFTERNGKKIRVIITGARIIDNKFAIERVKPEGKKDMSYADFQRGFKG